MDKRTLGYTYAIIAAVFSVVWIIAATFGYEYYNAYTIAFLWFAFASIFSFFLILITGKLREYRSFKSHWKFIILSNIFMSASVIVSFVALEILGPSLTGFVEKISRILQTKRSGGGFSFCGHKNN